MPVTQQTVIQANISEEFIANKKAFPVLHARIHVRPQSRFYESDKNSLTHLSKQKGFPRNFLWNFTFSFVCQRILRIVIDLYVLSSGGQNSKITGRFLRIVSK